MDPHSEKPLAMDRHLEVLRCSEDGGLLLAASCLTGRYWLGSLWYYQEPESAPEGDKCTAGVQLEAGVSDAQWVDSARVIVALDTGGVALWGLEDDRHNFVLSGAAAGHDDITSGVSVKCNKTQAVSCSYDGCIKEWDLSKMSLLSSYRAHTDRITCVDCHPTEPQVFVSCAQDGRLLLWDKRKPKPASILSTSPLDTLPTCVQWQPGNDHRMAVGSESGQIALIDSRLGVENFLHSSPHSRPVYRLQFSPKEPSSLASAGEDGRTVVSSIEADEMKSLYVDETHQDFVRGLAWSSLSPSELFTCGWDSQVIHHNVKAKMATIQGSRQTVPIHTKGSGNFTNGMVNGKSETPVIKAEKNINGEIINGTSMES